MAINSLSTGFRPGVCTSSTRPTAPYIGQHIYETDTLLEYVWNGSIWVRIYTANATTKGDIETFSTAPTRLPIGANNLALIADSSQSTGMKWGVQTGSVLQVVQTSYNTQVAHASATFVDTGLSATITPKFSSSKILVIANQCGLGKSGADTFIGLKLFRGATDLQTFAWSTAYTGDVAANRVGTDSTCYLDSPATTSAVTYKTQIANNASAGTVFAQVNSSLNASTMVLMEIAA